MSSPDLRAETPADIPAIHALHKAAFDGDLEARLVDALREDGEHVLSLVADCGGDIVGHLLLTELDAPFRALALAPVAVSPSYHGRGFGWQLITRAHDWAKAQGWDAIFVMGDPAYYQRFGYSVAAVGGYTCPYAGEYFMIKSFRSFLPPRGTVEYPPAFNKVETL